MVHTSHNNTDHLTFSRNYPIIKNKLFNFMPVPDFFSPDDSVKYLKNFEDNADSYLAALDYVKERIFEDASYSELNGEVLDALCKLTNKLVEDTNYSFAQANPEYKNIEQINSNVFHLENFRPED